MQDLKIAEFTTHQKISDIATKIETPYANREVGSIRLEAKMSCMQWQLGLIGAGVVGILGVSYPWVDVFTVTNIILYSW